MKLSASSTGREPVAELETANPAPVTRPGWLFRNDPGAVAMRIACYICASLLLCLVLYRANAVCFETIQPGMTRFWVWIVMGAPGDGDSNMWLWQGQFGTYAVFFDANGRVITKAGRPDWKDWSRPKRLVEILEYFQLSARE